MPNCIRCHKPIEDTPFCPHCGARQQRVRSVKSRGNGQGTAYKRGKTWTSKVIIGWRKDDDGSLHQVARTKSGFKTKREALEACSGLLSMSSSPPPTIRFSQLYDQWLPKYEERVSKSTMRCYKAAYKHCKSLYHMRFIDIHGDDLQACIDTCPAGKRTKENIKAFLSLLYKYAIHNDIVSKNRAGTLYTGDGKKGTRPAFTLDEVDRIRRAIGVVPFAGYIYCLIYLGYRPTEMLSLRKSDYDARHNCFYGGIKTEAGRNRFVTISPKIQPIIDELLKQDGEYIFSLTGTKPMTEFYFRNFCFSPCMEALHIVGRTPYSCRHTFANLLKAVAGSDTDKAALMGHSGTSQTKDYQSADYDSLQKITNKI